MKATCYLCRKKKEIYYVRLDGRKVCQKCFNEKTKIKKKKGGSKNTQRDP